jgi:putative radical SAM enzyme (TIGR03279 family)
MPSSKTESGLKINRVLPGSLSEAYGIQEGDRLLSINGHMIHDPIDYRYYESDERVVLEIVQKETRRVISVSKEIDQDLGLELKEPRYRTCRNHCIFCFVHQMPKGLRKTLYIKDDDYRLSFLHGNYITLTNLTDSDYDRIVQQNLSPLYVSVHATEEGIRKKILGNPDAPPLLPAMKRLASGGIRLHTQIVFCPDINDGEILNRTVMDLMRFWPHVESVAVVPVGLTRHRTSLVPLQGVGKCDAEHLIDQVHTLQKGCLEKYGTPWIFPSDEFYLKASRPFPPLDRYGELPQIENGVGMVPLFHREMEEGLEQLRPCKVKEPLVIGTGVLAYPLLNSLLQMIRQRTDCSMDLVPIRNRFFGDSVTVSGLITGRDLIHTFTDYPLPGPVILPMNMLRSGKGTFLDGMTIKGVEKRLGRLLKFVGNHAGGLLSLFKTPEFI